MMLWNWDPRAAYNPSTASNNTGSASAAYGRFRETGATRHESGNGREDIGET
jgi:hypothetical protein